MSEISAAQLARVTSFQKLIELLRDKLDWPIGEDYGFDDIVYEYEAGDLGLKENEVAKIREIHQLRPLVTGQPWGIFFISFEDKAISVTVLRRILRALVVKKRAGAQTPDRQTWNLHDLIFVTNFGRSGEREIAFAHFSDTSGDLPVLNVLGWNARDTTLHNDYVGQVLGERLRWPDDTANQPKWRETWGKAFELRLGEVARTSQDLARQLAGLASNIRANANELLSAETNEGPMRQLLGTFRKNLIHDLDEDGFADMFAQTISYGMLAARISRPMGIVADNLADMVPKTNPFLKELFGSFLNVGGRDKRQAMDFDELGVRNVVDMLNAANMQAVLRDFGDRNPKEDPVIHFYELFLKEYDAKKRMQRGVFYTPRPVVNFIVRGVDEVLREEFGLPLGLADTMTWGELAARNEKITIPKHVDPTQPFVQILDPATGTGTFLVEVIDLIHKRMEQHWEEQGRSVAEIKAAWNAYVPVHLLPRLTAFELMMAPYTIAHMKVGLKLSETGYSFESEERARIYLTSAMEPARSLDMEFDFMSEALAHEAQASNEAKASAPFTVVIGNPPYSRVSRNKGQFARALVQPFKDAVTDEKNQQPLEDDYLKFLSLAFFFAQRVGSAVICMITNHNFNEGVLFRGARKFFLDRSSDVTILSLHGEINPDGRPLDVTADQNVFEITTGVSISCFVIGQGSGKRVRDDLWGGRDRKLDALSESNLGALRSTMNPSAPLFLFKATSSEHDHEFLNWKKISEAFPENSSGVMTVRDQIAVDFTDKELLEKITKFADPSFGNAEIAELYGLRPYRNWTVEGARRRVRQHKDKASNIKRILYRPFDYRSIYYSSDLVTYPNTRVMDNFLVDNVAIVTSRINKGEDHAHEMISSCMVEIISLSSKSSNNAYVFPLWLRPSVSEDHCRPNIDRSWALRFANDLELNYEDAAPGSDQKGWGPGSRVARGDIVKSVDPKDLFCYTYAVLHSPTYRSRYAKFLKSDFPRIPTPKTRAAFWSLCALGRELVGTHLLRPENAPALATPEIRFAGTGAARVERGYPDYKNGRVMINATRWFEDVPRETWEFQVGGYQVCEKWLKDRAGKGGKNPSAGRLLTDEDILHYRRVVTALTETRRLMVEIDNVIDEHGGWPGAFDVPPPPPPSIEEIVGANESLELEFKATFQWDVKESKQNKDLQKSVLKTLAAFMNTEGGTLVIGVTDDKVIYGLDDDLNLTRNSLDVFEQNFLSAFSNTIGAAYAQHISVRFADASRDKKVCVIVAAPSPEPVFLEFQGKQEFYVRRGNASVALNPSDQHTYVRQRFKAN